MTEIRIEGSTKAIKESLKRTGFRWEAATQSWVRRITDEQARAIVDSTGEQRKEVLRALGACKKGCRVLLAYAGTIGQEVYRSPTYSGGVAAGPDPDGHGWNCDQYGNPVASTRIPGSAPDDCI